jgi:phosphopantothenoylcysteine synthetase/decarboxylase
MPESPPARVLYHVVCGAGPAVAAGRLAELAQARGWQVQVIATPAALDFLDVATVEALTGRSVRSTYQSAPGAQRQLSHADAVVVAPATYNTINKWAAGISDSYALGILAETTGLGLPTAVLPFVNTALAANPALTRSVDLLRSAGVHILIGPGQWEPHTPGTGSDRIAAYPWELPLDVADRLVTPGPPPKL